LPRVVVFVLQLIRMAPRRPKVLTFRPDMDLFEAMTRYRELTGVPFAEQLRRSLREWLAQRTEARLSKDAKTTRTKARRRTS